MNEKKLNSRESLTTVIDTIDEDIVIAARSSLFKIYCDGACSGNPGPGGWGAVIIMQQYEDDRDGGNKIIEISGSSNDTTNNRMEMIAAIEALKKIENLIKDGNKYNIDNKNTKKITVKVYTDSIYLKNGITEWINKWKMNGWINKNGKIKNQDLWKELDLFSNNASADYEVKWCIEWLWIKGHNGDLFNDRADKLATSAITQFKS